MRECGKVLGLILARGGSTGVIGKNIRPLNGKPLIAHTIETAKTSRLINRIVVATDSPEIASVAKSFGAEVPIERPAEISGKLSRGYDVYRHVIKNLKDREFYRPDVVVMMFATSYSRTVEEVDAAVEKLIATKCDWVFTVTECEHHPYRCFTPIEDGAGDRMEPFCRNVPSFDLWGNRQELPPVYRINGNAFVTWTEHIENFTTYNVDGREFAETDVRYVICPQEHSLDIDTEHDFEMAELVMSRRGGAVHP